MTEGMIDRYELIALVSSAGSVQLWQGFDPALDRAVAIQLLPMSDPRCSAVAAAARRAATIDERRLVGVLDVLTDVPVGDNGSLAIVTEWVEGRTLADIHEEREGEPIPAADALPLVRQVALAIKASQDQGSGHGRLRPGTLIIADTPELGLGLMPAAPGDIDSVRIRGLAVDAALWPSDESDVAGDGPSVVDHAAVDLSGDDLPGDDLPAVDPDVHGIGCLLYATVTGRWPGGLVDGMSPAPRAGGRLLPPSQVIADVPPIIDEICQRSIDPRVSGDWPPRRGRTPYPDLAALTTALNVATERVTAARAPRRLTRRDEGSVDTPRRPMSVGRRILRGVGRLAAAIIALALVGGLAMFGMRLATSSASPWGVDPTAVESAVLTETARPEASATLAPGAVPGEIVPVAAMAHDPFGADKDEMPDLVDMAFDDKPDTAWTTDQYWSQDLDGKPGVGLVLDLGTPQNVSAVRLELVGSGSSIQVLVSPTMERKPSKWLPLAQAEGVGTAIDLRSPRPVIGRYVLIWFTALPVKDGVYQGGLRDVTVLA